MFTQTIVDYIAYVESSAETLQDLIAGSGEYSFEKLCDELRTTTDGVTDPFMELYQAAKTQSPQGTEDKNKSEGDEETENFTEKLEQTYASFFGNLSNAYSKILLQFPPNISFYPLRQMRGELDSMSRHLTEVSKLFGYELENPFPQFAEETARWQKACAKKEGDMSAVIDTIEGTQDLSNKLCFAEAILAMHGDDYSLESLEQARSSLKEKHKFVKQYKDPQTTKLYQRLHGIIGSKIHRQRSTQNAEGQRAVALTDKYQQLEGKILQYADSPQTASPPHLKGTAQPTARARARQDELAAQVRECLNNGKLSSLFAEKEEHDSLRDPFYLERVQALAAVVHEEGETHSLRQLLAIQECLRDYALGGKIIGTRRKKKVQSLEGYVEARIESKKQGINGQIELLEQKAEEYKETNWLPFLLGKVGKLRRVRIADVTYRINQFLNEHDSYQDMAEPHRERVENLIGQLRDDVKKYFRKRPDEATKLHKSLDSSYTKLQRVDETVQIREIAEEAGILESVMDTMTDGDQQSVVTPISRLQAKPLKKRYPGRKSLAAALCLGIVGGAVLGLSTGAPDEKQIQLDRAASAYAGSPIKKETQSGKYTAAHPPAPSLAASNKKEEPVMPVETASYQKKPVKSQQEPTTPVREVIYSGIKKIDGKYYKVDREGNRLGRRIQLNGGWYKGIVLTQGDYPIQIATENGLHFSEHSTILRTGRSVRKMSLEQVLTIVEEDFPKGKVALRTSGVSYWYPGHVVLVQDKEIQQRKKQLTGTHTVTSGEASLKTLEFSLADALDGSPYFKNGRFYDRCNQGVDRRRLYQLLLLFKQQNKVVKRRDTNGLHQLDRFGNPVMRKVYKGIFWPRDVTKATKQLVEKVMECDKKGTQRQPGRSFRGLADANRNVLYSINTFIEDKQQRQHLNSNVLTEMIGTVKTAYHFLKAFGEGTKDDLHELRVALGRLYDEKRKKEAVRERSLSDILAEERNEQANFQPGLVESLERYLVEKPHQIQKVSARIKQFAEKNADYVQRHQGKFADLQAFIAVQKGNNCTDDFTGVLKAAPTRKTLTAKEKVARKKRNKLARKARKKNRERAA